MQHQITCCAAPPCTTNQDTAAVSANHNAAAIFSANQNTAAPCSSNEGLSGGMAIRRRRRKKRETVEEASLVDTPPHNMELSCSSRTANVASSSCIKKSSSSTCAPSSCSVCSCGGVKTRPKAYSEGSEIEPLSGIDTTASNNSRNAVSSAVGTTSGGNGNGVGGNCSTIKPSESTGSSHSHRVAVKDNHSYHQHQPHGGGGVHMKSCSCSINQRSMIDNQKTRFARNFHELQGGMHRCGVSVKDQIDIYRRFKQLAVTVPIESDSFTDNPAASNSRKPQKRHKRRMKKMAIGMTNGVSPESNMPTLLDTVITVASGGSLNPTITKSSLKHINIKTTDVPTVSHVSAFTSKDTGDCDTLTRKKPSEEFSLESLEDLDLNSYLTNLPTNLKRGSPWKGIPFHFTPVAHLHSSASITSSAVNHTSGAVLPPAVGDSSLSGSNSYAMECDDTSSNTLEGGGSSCFILNSSNISATSNASTTCITSTATGGARLDRETVQCKCATGGATHSQRSVGGAEEGIKSHGATEEKLGDSGEIVDAVFASSGSGSPLSSSSPNQDDDTSGGLFTADEGREGDDELSENDDGSSVCGLPCAVPWWEEGEMSEDTSHRPQFPSQLQHILEGIKAVTENETINSLLKSSAAALLNPSIPKRAFPASDKKGPDLLFFDNSSESYELLTSPDGSSKSKRSRYSASLINAAGLSSRHRYSKFHSGKYRKKRRRSYSAGENKNRPTSSISNFRFNKGDANSGTTRKIERSNVGHQMLINMGWQPGTGLGFTRSGIAEPVFLASQTDKKGFGFCSDRKLSTNSSNVT